MDGRPYDTGTILSGAAHAALIGWMVLGGVFSSEPPEMQVQTVSVISQGQFEELLNQAPQPDATVEVAQPAPPPVPEPQPVPEPDTPIAVEEPEPITPPEPLPTPEPEPLPDVAPEPPQPEEVAVVEPEPVEEAVPDQADRVAPEPVAEPEPEAVEDTQEQTAVDENTAGEAQEDAQEATAPPESTTELVTEADEPTTAPTTSLRPPKSRPARPTPPVQTAEPEPAPQQDDPVSDAVADAVAAALSENTAPTPTPRSGPPLTGREREGLRVAVSTCWNVGALSTEAQETKVVVYVEMNENGTPKTDTIRMLSSAGGSAASAQRVFDTARRAIIRCGRDGFPLPVEKFSQWREIEMTFDPEGMFWR